MGRDKGIFQAEGIDLQMILVASTIQVTALTTGDIDFSGAQSQVMAGAARGLAVKVVGFLTIKPSFWLMAKPEIKSMAGAQRQDHRYHRHWLIHGYAGALL